MKALNRYVDWLLRIWLVEKGERKISEVRLSHAHWVHQDFYLDSNGDEGGKRERYEQRGRNKVTQVWAKGWRKRSSVRLHIYFSVTRPSPKRVRAAAAVVRIWSTQPHKSRVTAQTAHRGLTRENRRAWIRARKSIVKNCWKGCRRKAFDWTEAERRICETYGAEVNWSW